MCLQAKRAAQILLKQAIRKRKIKWKAEEGGNKEKRKERKEGRKKERKSDGKDGKGREGGSEEGRRDGRKEGREQKEGGNYTHFHINT